MKQVLYEGQTFEVPDWAKWIVADVQDGCVYAYECKPYKESGYYNSAEGDAKYLGMIEPPKFPLVEI